MVDTTPKVEKLQAEIESEDDVLKKYIKAECMRKGLDYKIVYAVIEIESNWQHDLVGDDGESFGLMQIQPRWHRERMDRMGVTNLLEAKQNILVGCDLLAELIKNTSGDIDAALTIYNVGHDDGTREYAERVNVEMKTMGSE